MEMKKIIDLLESRIENPSQGLPEDLFLFITTVTPMINVDLLIKNEQNHTLLTWRDDGYWAPGWHVPGGIIRYKETIADRLKAVSAHELGAKITFKQELLAVNEFVHPSKRVRGHFISLLYACKLIGPPDKNLKFEKGIPKPGEWAWHSRCPEDVISIHGEMYRKYM